MINTFNKIPKTNTYSIEFHVLIHLCMHKIWVSQKSP